MDPEFFSGLSGFGVPFRIRIRPFKTILVAESKTCLFLIGVSDPDPESIKPVDPDLGSGSNPGSQKLPTKIEKG
jgi:hypothetical protein